MTNSTSIKESVVKEQLAEKLSDKKVLSVLVHTFNFDPRFFENYVMPLFVSEADIQFKDEEIFNKIQWRKCDKEGWIPPISVYCDFYAKDNTVAPSLGYDIHCIKMPSAKGHLSSFHPKHLFILLEDGERKKSLLIITGSGNLTVNGWCDNFECFSFEEIKQDKRQPNRVTTNKLQDFLDNINYFAKNRNRTIAHQLIHDFLKRVDFNIPFFNSTSISFSDFLEKELPLDNINEVEIISPYFSKDADNVKCLKKRGISTIKCLIPTLRKNEVMIGEDVFLKHQELGVEWCYWQNNEYNKEVRNLHAKIYRFYTANKTFTFIGSVNFTKPAWGLVTKKDTKANIESAWLYRDNNILNQLLKKPKSLNINDLRFIDKKELEGADKASAFNRNAPDLFFVIDWKTRTLDVKAKIKPKEKCHFFQYCDDREIIGNESIELNKTDIKHFARHSLIQVKVTRDDKEEFYFYYANQINISSKPIGFYLNARTILKYWHFFDDISAQERITKQLSEAITDDNGGINEEKLNQKSLLNDMAAHFTGLVQLEKYLFKKDLGKRQQDYQFKSIQYYLLTENIDTLPFYLEDIRQQHEKKEIQNSFLWMVYQIVINNFYDKAKDWVLGKGLNRSEIIIFRKDIDTKREALVKEANLLMKKIDKLDHKKSLWIQQQIIEIYE